MEATTMYRYVIVLVNCINFDNNNIIQVYAKKISKKVQDKCFYLNSNEMGCLSDDDMTFDTFRRILSSMTRAELLKLRKNIEGDKNGIIKSMLDDEYKRRRIAVVKDESMSSLGLIKASQLGRGK
ncbi:MAG: hypothetical protein ACI4N3_02065 [Alphaproteobacteria bacterium]